MPHRARPAWAGPERSPAGTRRYRRRPRAHDRLQGRTARYAVRARRLLTVDRQLDLLDRLHARQRRAAPDDILRLFRRGARQHDRDRVRQESVHVVSVLRGVDALDLSAGHPQAERRSHSRRPHLSRAPARHVAPAVSAGNHRHLGSRRDARFQARRHFPGRYRRACHRRSARCSTCSASARRR